MVGGRSTLGHGTSIAVRITLLCRKRARTLVRLWRSVRRSGTLAFVLGRGVCDLMWHRPRSRADGAKWFHRYCAWAAQKLEIQIRSEGEFPERGVVISNHLGYLDAIAFATLHPCVFVAKAGVRHWPVMGWISWMVGTVYVEPGRGGSAQRAEGHLRSAADEGVSVVFFPEGTSTDGTHVLPFRSGLLTKVREEEQPVTAAYIRYSLTKDNGPDVSVENDLCWSDTPLFWHMFRALGLRGVEATVRFAETPIAFHAALSDRKAAADEARTAVLALSPAAERVTAD